jgi:hypothetical protein
MSFEFKLTVNEVNLVLKALGVMPYGDSVQLINKMSGAAKVQQEAFEKANKDTE